MIDRLLSYVTFIILNRIGGVTVSVLASSWLGIRIMCSGGGDMSIHGLLFQWASTIKIQLSVLV